MQPEQMDIVPVITQQSAPFSATEDHQKRINGLQLLGDCVSYSKYSKYKPEELARESWPEVCNRLEAMFVAKYPELQGEIQEAVGFVRRKEVFPSMRALQFAGKAIELNHARIYNCSFRHMDETAAFKEFLFLLLSGCGVGYSVQRHHVAKLPEVRLVDDGRTARYIISDDIIGWAEALNFLIKSYMHRRSRSRPRPVFDYRDIRPKGTLLKTSGGRAPGPDGLREMLEAVEQVLRDAAGRQLRPFEVHRINCLICNAVLSGGIRRSSALSLFSPDDIEMRDCKKGFWWEKHPELGRCNNSAIVLRESLTYEWWTQWWESVKHYGTGEPGIFLTNNLEWGANPCVEAALPAFTFCNLTNLVIPAQMVPFEEQKRRTWAAAFINTLQASFTDFHYLDPRWKENTEKHALTGISLTGCASRNFKHWQLDKLAEYAKQVNADLAARIGIRPSARITLLKPSGNSSCVAETSSGLSRWHAPFYIRRMQLNKTEPIYAYVKEKFPALVEDYWEKPETTAVLSIPIEAPDGAVIDDVNDLQSMLDDIERVYREWIAHGHNWGDNMHTVSVTVRLQDHQWKQMYDWFWDNRDAVSCISVLPYDGGTYKQAPFEEITEAEYHSLMRNFDGVRFDLTEITEDEDMTDHNDSVACAGGACTITAL